MTDPHTQASDEADLLPCPFCGGEKAFVERADLSSCYVVCNNCATRGPETCCENDADFERDEAGDRYPGETTARRYWNTRADLDALRKENERLRYLLWHGWREMNAIRARSGVPLDFDGTTQCVDEGYWSQTVDAMADALGDDAKPWPPKPTPHDAGTPETKGET